MNPLPLLRPVPDWLKRVGEATLIAVCAALAGWAVEEGKVAVRAKRERIAADKNAIIPPPGPESDTTIPEETPPDATPES